MEGPKAGTIFLMGAVGYTALEILWRGYSHWSMTLTGGGCLLAVHRMNRRHRGEPLLRRCALGSGIITAAEFGVGVLVNRVLGWNVWDYSRLPMNLLGQICLPYSLLWFLLCLPLIGLCSLFDRGEEGVLRLLEGSNPADECGGKGNFPLE